METVFTILKRNLMTTFYPRASRNDRLQSLCGAFDENIKLIEKEFNLNISRNSILLFTVKSNDESPKPHHEN